MALARLAAGARRLGIELTPQQLEQFEALGRELLDWNRRHNLTAITERAEIERLHFLDSLSCLRAIAGPAGGCPGRVSLIDVGAGAGLPGLPLKIVCPELRLTLVESVGKKAAFMEHAAAALGLRGVRVLTARAEELGQDRRLREQFDWAVARAVASVAVLAEYLLPLARVGGAALMPKKGELAAELAAAEPAWRLLGGEPPEIVPVDLAPDLEADRVLVVSRKVRPTPTGYPRRVGLPAKKPLGS